VLNIVGDFDISCQVSFTETFNIVSADAVWRGIPIVTSREVEWVPGRYQVREADSISEIISRLQHAERAGLRGTQKCLQSLLNWNHSALKLWKSFLKEKV
jgi:hypothetical protein